jgi:tRNA G18 (ribose-2'-O)-methylase SpoU
VRRAHQDVRSEHGDRLALFCYEIACSAGLMPCSHIETILRYLVDNGNTRNGHAAGYIVQGFDLAPDWVANFATAELAIVFPDRIQFSQAQRAMVLHHCVSISRRFKPETLSEDDKQQLSERLPVFLRRQHSLKMLAETEILLVQSKIDHSSPTHSKLFDSNLLSLEEFEERTAQSTGPCSHIPGTCLHKKGLVAGCEYLLEILDSGTVANPILVLRVLHTLWFEVERQEFPRSVATVIPRLFLHIKVIKASSTDMDMKQAVTKYIWNLWEVCKGKIYFWKPLAAAFREAFLHCPGFLEQLKIEDIIVAFVNEPPTPNSEFLLDAALAKRERQYCHIDIPIFADESQGHYHIFEILNRLQQADLTWARLLMEHLLQPWLQQVEPVSIVSKWKRTSQLQAILLIHESLRSPTRNIQYSQTEKLLAAETLKDMYTFLYILALEPLPRYRFLLEWIIIATALSTPDDTLLCDSMLLTLLSTDDSNPKHVASMITITMQLAMNQSIKPSATGSQPKVASRHLEHDETETSELRSKLRDMKVPLEIIKRLSESTELHSNSTSESSIPQEHETFTLRLLSHLAALMASPRIQIKHEAMWCFPILFEHATSSSFTTITSNPVLRSMNNFIRSLDKYKNPPESRTLESFDYSKDRNLATLFQGGYMRIEPPGHPLVHIEDLKGFLRGQVEDGLGQDQGNLPFGLISTTPRNVSVVAKLAASTNLSIPSSSATQITNNTTPLQTKSLNLDYTAMSPFAKDTSDKVRGNGPILIASLIENPHNLGGLSRVAEIFGCSSVHVADAMVLKKHDFKRVSVNSEDHLAFHKTEPQNLLVQLRERKAEGWIIVGVEQTDSSVVIGMPGEEGNRGKVLPRNAVVVMGAEKTGIPADVLAECDVCVEIRQWGVTRSLNVQTAAACVLCEWRREWGGEGAVDRSESVSKEAS